MCIRDRSTNDAALQLWLQPHTSTTKWRSICAVSYTHLSGAIAGTLCAIGFMEYGPLRLPLRLPLRQTDRAVGDRIPSVSYTHLNNVVDGVSIDVLPEIYEAGFPVMADGHLSLIHIYSLGRRRQSPG